MKYAVPFSSICTSPARTLAMASPCAADGATCVVARAAVLPRAFAYAVSKCATAITNNDS